jgi:hypothetical protein
MDKGIRKILTNLTAEGTNEHYLVTERSLIITGKYIGLSE